MTNLERFAIGIMSAWGLYAVHEGVNALVRAHDWQPMTISDWGTWIGSIGTVATLIGTIYLATAETRKRVRHEQVAAALHSAAIEMRMAHAQGHLHGAKVILEHIAATGKPNPQLLKQAHDLVLGIDEPSSDELLPLAVLKNNTAIVVVKTSTSLRALRNIAHIFAKTTTNIPLENAKTLLDSINVNLRMVEVAIASLSENRIELNADQ